MEKLHRRSAVGGSNCVAHISAARRIAFLFNNNIMLLVYLSSSIYLILLLHVVYLSYFVYSQIDFTLEATINNIKWLVSLLKKNNTK